jgi:hypothetical protein
MADSIFRRLVYAVREKYPVAAERISATHVAASSWPVGRLECLEHKTPPYIGWVRGAVQFRSPVKAGPKQITQGPEAQSVDPLSDVAQVVTAIICGRDEAETELIWYATLGAVRDFFGAQPLLFGPGAWMTQEEGKAGYIHAGVEVVLQEFNWLLTVPRTIQPLTVITATEHDCEGIVP